jgi:hypothetical protein
VKRGEGRKKEIDEKKEKEKEMSCVGVTPIDMM